MTPAERRLRGRIGAFTLHARGGTTTEAARRKFMERFELEVDPEGVLVPEVRAKRAAAARSLYFARLAYLSARRRART